MTIVLRARPLAAILAALAPASLAGAAGSASYVVRLAGDTPPAFEVAATLPAGERLGADTTRPGDLPELLDGGWPVLIAELSVRDASGQSIPVEADGAAGWRVARSAPGPYSVSYRVDTALLARNGWPAPREAGFVDGTLVSIVGRALFLTTETTADATVRFEPGTARRAWAPWQRGDAEGSYHVRSPERLRENLIVFSGDAPLRVESAGFRVLVFPAGWWRGHERDLRAVVRSHVRRFVRLMGFEGDETYLALLLPLSDRGAEAYRASLALTFPDTPDRSNRAAWANLLGHEIFHFWNAGLLQGAEYAPSQWFQEGFTEYVANVSTSAGGFMTPDEFRDKLAGHVASSRRLTTSLAEPGTHKGPPLYSAGALVAFTWDAAIREASAGRRDLGDFLRALLRRTDGGARPYSTAGILAALEDTAPGDWAGFVERHVRGTEPLPLEAIFSRAGLRLVEREGAPALEDAPPAAAEPSSWRRLARGFR